MMGGLRHVQLSNEYLIEYCSISLESNCKHQPQAKKDMGTLHLV